MDNLRHLLKGLPKGSQRKALTLQFDALSIRVQAAIERSLKAQTSMLSQLRGLAVKRVRGVDELQLKHSGATFVLQPLPCTGSNSGLSACRCSAQGPPCEPDAELWVNGQTNGQANGQGDSPAGITILFQDTSYSSVAQFAQAFEVSARADNSGRSSSAMDVDEGAVTTLSAGAHGEHDSELAKREAALTMDKQVATQKQIGAKLVYRTFMVRQLHKRHYLIREFFARMKCRMFTRVSLCAVTLQSISECACNIPA